MYLVPRAIIGTGHSEFRNFDHGEQSSKIETRVNNIFPSNWSRCGYGDGGGDNLRPKKKKEI